MAAGTGIVKCLSNKPGIATGTLLKGKSWVKNIPTSAGALARASHGQRLLAFRALILAEQDPQKEILNLFFKMGYANLDSL
jgi:hypothetical protein